MSGRRRTVHVDRESLVAMLAEKMTLAQMAERLGTTTTTVNARLREHGLKATYSQERRRWMPDDGTFRRLLQEGKGRSEIAAEYGVGVEVVRKAARRLGFEFARRPAPAPDFSGILPRPQPVRGPRSPLPADDRLRALLAVGITQAEVARRYGVSRQAVAQILGGRREHLPLSPPRSPAHGRGRMDRPRNRGTVRRHESHNPARAARGWPQDARAR